MYSVPDKSGLQDYPHGGSSPRPAMTSCRGALIGRALQPQGCRALVFPPAICVRTPLSTPGGHRSPACVIGALGSSVAAAGEGEGMAANIRDVRLRRIGRDDVVASALGNNAAWLCSCGRKTPLIGSLMIARGEVSCPSCGQQYRVVADARPEVAGAMMTMRWCPTAESTWGELPRPGGPPGTRARSDEAALVCRRARCC